MHVMDEVREGCDTQPSSPGHAEVQRSEIREEEEQQQQHATENGVCSDEDKAILIDEHKIEEDVHHADEDSSNESDSEQPGGKRKRAKNESSSAKKLRSDAQINFGARDKIFQQYIETVGCGNVEQIQLQTEQLLAEVRTLNELAREKEREWNNIIHLKKMKEELLLRLQRQKQVMLIGDRSDLDEAEALDFHGQSLLKPKLNLQRSGAGGGGKALLSKQRNFPTQHNHHSDMNGQQQKRNVVDVQSIIADYRQRHPETVPRRGRRIRSILNHGAANTGIGSKILKFASLALASGSQMRHGSGNAEINSEIGLPVNPMDGCERPESQNPAKPTFPEVTVHPVTTPSPQPTNSLLHGILTKAHSKTDTKTTFSPTLARLLTAPERSAGHQGTNASSLMANSNVSISDILSCSKARNEITITPVGSQFEVGTTKGKNDEEEADDSVDRLVIDEGGGNADARARSQDNASDAGDDEVPQCQGCNLKSAQFVCAGCGNQWYCSRECQVSAWDEHSEVCSG